MATERPIGVSILSILSWIGGAITILFGILLAIGLSAIGSLGEASPGSLPYLAGIGIFAGVILLALGILSIIIGTGLWRGRNWARILGLILCSISLVLSLISIIADPISAIFGVAINGLIIWYLGFSDAKNYFK